MRVSKLLISFSYELFKMLLPRLPSFVLYQFIHTQNFVVRNRKVRRIELTRLNFMIEVIREGTIRVLRDLRSMDGSVHLLEGCRPPLQRSEEHTSELQSRRDLVCRLL